MGKNARSALSALSLTLVTSVTHNHQTGRSTSLPFDMLQTHHTRLEEVTPVQYPHSRCYRTKRVS